MHQPQNMLQAVCGWSSAETQLRAASQAQEAEKGTLQYDG